MRSVSKLDDDMHKSADLKLFWLDHIDESLDLIIDMGCGDGYLGSLYGPLYPEARMVGIERRQECRENIYDSGFNQHLFRLPPFERVLPVNKISLVILSSVLHEDKKLLGKVIRLRPTYIVIRDMIYPHYSTFDRHTYKEAERVLKLSYCSTGEDYRRELNEDYFSLSTSDLKPIENFYEILHFSSSCHPDISHLVGTSHISAVYKLKGDTE